MDITQQASEELEKILPEDLARTFESAYHVFKGEAEHIDDLLKSGGTLLRKASKRLTQTQMIIGIAVLAIAAVVAINKAQEE
jgi:23S rRNA U2552 (ribose-2'-O)-methylase RlmE/FtsJ